MKKQLIAIVFYVSGAVSAIAQPAMSPAYIAQISPSASFSQISTTELMKPVVQLISQMPSVPIAGPSNLSLVLQQGTGNQASISQFGSRNVGLIHQIGLDNVASITQRGIGHQAMLSQQGSNNVAIIRQR